MTPSLDAEFRDLEQLRRLHELVRACSPDSPPRAEVLLAERVRGRRQIAVLSGSFNPPTAAHLALAAAAERARLGPIVFALSTRTVDKERLEGALLEDRLLMLLLGARSRPGWAVALVNRGLYVDQAELLRAALPDLERLTFVVGFDKIVQIFDPRYYDHRDRALRRLFAAASFAVAPRAGAGPEELAALLAQPENRPFATAVQPLAVPPGLAEVSSSAIRAALAAGQPPPSELPPAVAAFVRATGCYQPPLDHYARERAALLEGWAPPPRDKLRGAPRHGRPDRSPLPGGESALT